MKKELSPSVSMYIKPVYEMGHPVMALSVLRGKQGFQGVVREIVDRRGDPSIEGFVDRSNLHLLESDNGLEWRRRKELSIKGIDNVVRKSNKGDMEFIGLEDPHIWVHPKKSIHLFFTIAYKLLKQPGFGIVLGHAEGQSLESLVATPPVLSPKIKDGIVTPGFKEAAISPITYKFGRVNLVERGYGIGETTIDAVLAEDMGREWEHLRTVANPHDMTDDWIQGDLSPGPIFDPSFIRHKNLLVGIVNGRSPAKIDKGSKKYGKFRIGLMLFNPKTGEIPWISQEPLIDDPCASITFASDFIQTDREKGVLYAHIDDRFVRAYEVNSSNLRKLLRRAS